ncbi:MAG: hypothetical protein EGR23_07665 [Holdemanella biformis]|nr:hypothetical protein [Holdemanella biformis]
MDENLEKRMQVQAAVNEWVNNFMRDNNLSASIMEDALSKTLLSIKDQAMREFLIYVQAQTQVDPVSDIVEEVEDGCC